MVISLNSAVSGLRAHQTRMDVIGNNIANVNTIGFKGSRSTFQEVFNQTFKGSAAPDPATGRGGTNPMQVGLGMGVSAIDVAMGSGSVTRTDSPTDLSIEGEGFFTIRAGSSGAYTFTRAGNFSIDRAGNLVTASGANVYGWMKYEKNTDGEYIFDTQVPIQALNLYDDQYNFNKRIIAAQVSAKAVLGGNLDARELPKGLTLNTITDLAVGPSAIAADGIPDKSATENAAPDFIVPVTVYDRLGNAYKVNVQYFKNFVQPATAGPPATTPVTSYYWRVGSEADGVDSAGNPVPSKYYALGGTAADVAAGTPQATTFASGYIQFDSNGKLITPPPAGYEVNPSIKVQPAATFGSASFNVELDMTKLSMYANDASVKPLQVDGYPPGSLVTFSVGSDGILTGVYDNGRQQPLGRIGLATFANPAGLVKAGNNLFMATSNSGEFSNAVTPGSSGSGTIVPGTLEMSNVDLAKQFTEMIVTQRGFQANSRVITTSDEILQELTNLKR